MRRHKIYKFGDHLIICVYLYRRMCFLSGYIVYSIFFQPREISSTRVGEYFIDCHCELPQIAFVLVTSGCLLLAMINCSSQQLSTIDNDQSEVMTTPCRRWSQMVNSTELRLFTLSPVPILHWRLDPVPHFVLLLLLPGCCLQCPAWPVLLILSRVLAVTDRQSSSERCIRKGGGWSCKNIYNCWYTFVLLNMPMIIVHFDAPPTSKKVLWAI